MWQQTPAIIVVTPLVSALVIFASGWRRSRLAHPMVLGAMSVCCLCSGILLTSVVRQGAVAYRLGGWEPPWGIAYRVDHFNAVILVLVSFLGWAAAVYAKSSVARELPQKAALFWCLYLLLFTGLLGIAITGDLFNLFVLLEVASLAGYCLVAVGSGKAAVAGFRYLVIGTIGASFYLLGTGYLYIVTGSLNMENLQALLPPLYASRAVRAAFVFIFIGLGIKIALFPLHAWQPDAYTYAPSAVTVVLSTAVAKTFTYALLRVIFSVFTIDFVAGFLPVFSLICWIAALAMLAGSVFAIAQQNLKRMLAYSSVANVGYIVLAVGLVPWTSLGLTPAVLHIINHAVIKGCMFMAAGAFIYRLGLADVRSLTGLGRKMPLSCLALILAALAMIGMPPGAGFISKWYLVLAALEAGRYGFVAVIFVSTLLMIVYFWRVVEILYIRIPEAEAAADVSGVKEAPPSMSLSCLFLGILSFALGVVWMSGILQPLLDGINADLGLAGGAP